MQATKPQHAHAAFGSAIVDLTTTGSAGTQTASTTRHTNTGGYSSGTLSVDVNLLAGKPLQSGSYGGILVLTIDPLL